MPLLSLSFVQLLLAFVSASILHKLTVNRFFLKWLASHRLERYLAPSNGQLKRLRTKENQGPKKNHSRQRNRHKRDYTNDSEKDEVFKIPTAHLDDLQMEKKATTFQDFDVINFSVDLEWIADLALMSLFSFMLTQIQFYFYPQTEEYNFSLLWGLLVIVYCVKILWKLTATYFRNDKTIGERSICIISGCLFLLLAMTILLAKEDFLELGFESAYKSFNDSATAFVHNKTILGDTPRPTTRPISFILVKFTTAIICSLVGVVFTFPGLRFGQLQKGLLDSPRTTSLQHFTYTLNYLLPLFIVCLWIRPVSRKLFTSLDTVYLDDAQFDVFRIYFVIIANFFRFFLLPSYVSVFLLSAANRVTRIKQRGGVTTNEEIQLTVTGIYSYVNVVTIQYILPILMCIFASVMFKAKSGHNWITLNSLDPNNGTSAMNATTREDEFVLKREFVTITNESNLTFTESNITTSIFTEGANNLIGLKRIFSDDVFRGIFGLTTWWLHFAWFCTSTAGVIYHTYFIH